MKISIIISMIGYLYRPEATIPSSDNVTYGYGRQSFYTSGPLWLDTSRYSKLSSDRLTTQNIVFHASEYQIYGVDLTSNTCTIRLVPAQ